MTGLLLIALVAIIGLNALAKRGAPKRRYTARDWTKIPIHPDSTLGTLANVTGVISGLIGSNFTHDIRITSVRATWSLDNFTPGEGPISFGYCHGDYSLAEVEEWLEQAQPLGPNSLIEREVAKRLIRRVGTFSGVGASEVFNDGRPVKTKLNWLIADGQTIRHWVYSHGGTANLTTGAVVRQLGVINGFWT